MGKQQINKTIRLLITFTMIFTFLLLVIPPINASDYSITIKDTRYEETKTKTVGSEIIQYYNIYVILTNEGTSISDNITVELLEEGVPVTKTYAIQPGESKSYVFSDYPSPTKEITINYYPTDENIDKTNQNSGTKIFQLGSDNKTEDSTPSIHFLIILGSILCITLIKKKRKKR